MRALVLALLAAGACSFDRPGDICDTPCSLFGIDRAVVNETEQIYLEGVFMDGMVVNFPGATQPQSVDSRYGFRATVTVPAEATAGDVTITWPDGTTSPRIPFRKPAFGMSLGSFQAFDDQTTFGQHYDASPHRRGHTAIVLGQRLYLVGGITDNGPNPDPSVEMRLVGLDGSITYGMETPAMAHGRAFHSMVRAGDFVYVIGGRGAESTVEVAPVSKLDGSLGGFAPAQGVTLRTPRTDHASALIGNYIYVFGGVDTNGTVLSSIERAEVYENGKLGDFEVMTGVTLPGPLANFTVAVVRDYLYVIGGRDDTGSDVFTISGAYIDPETSFFSSFETSGRLNQPRSHHVSLVVGTELVVIGGEHNGAAINTVERSPIVHIDPTAVSFQLDEPKLREPRRDAVAVIIGNFAYVLGGEKAVGQPSELYERVSFIAAAGFAGFAIQPSTPQLFVARAGHAAVVIGNELYVIGGTSSTGEALPSIEHTSILPDGSLVGFAGAGVQLSTPRTGASVTVFHDTILVAGGIVDTGAQTQTNEIEAFKFDSVGSITSPTTLVQTLGTAQDRMATVVLPNAIYWIGGQAGTGSDPVEKATTAGSLGTPMIVSPPPSIPARRGATGVVLGETYYLLGGVDTNGATPRAIAFPIGTDNTLQASRDLSSLSDDWNRDGHRLVVFGDEAFMLGGDLSKTALAPPGPAPPTSIRPFGNELVAGPLMFAFDRRDFATVTLGDYVYAIGGSVDGTRVGTLSSAKLGAP